MGNKPTTNKALKIVTVNGVKADGGGCGGDHSHAQDGHVHNCGHADHEHTAPTEVKVKFIFKLINFCCAVLTLSWFFEGWRQVNANPSVEHFALLLVGTVLTILFLGVHGYWVYIEEKSKGTLKRQFGLFEKIHAATNKKRDEASVLTSGKGEN